MVVVVMVVVGLEVVTVAKPGKGRREGMWR